MVDSRLLVDEPSLKSTFVTGAIFFDAFKNYRYPTAKYVQRWIYAPYFHISSLHTWITHLCHNRYRETINFQEAILFLVMQPAVFDGVF